MGAHLFERGRQGFLEGSVDFDTDNIKAVLVDLNDWSKVVSGATNATPIVVTATAHGYSNGDVVAQTGVGGNTAANGRFKVAAVSANTYELTDYVTGANVAGNGAYTSGGLSTRLNGDLNLSDIPAGGRIATSANLASKTVTDGVADAADVTYTAVTGDQFEAVVVYKDTGTATTSRLVWYCDQGTNLPLTPNGGDVTVAWANTAERIFRL